MQIFSFAVFGLGSLAKDIFAQKHKYNAASLIFNELFEGEHLRFWLCPNTKTHIDTEEHGYLKASWLAQHQQDFSQFFLKQ